MRSPKKISLTPPGRRFDQAMSPEEAMASSGLPAYVDLTARRSATTIRWVVVMAMLRDGLQADVYGNRLPAQSNARPARPPT
jgi:hypothetical protein